MSVAADRRPVSANGAPQKPGGGNGGKQKKRSRGSANRSRTNKSTSPGPKVRSPLGPDERLSPVRQPHVQPPWSNASVATKVLKKPGKTLRGIRVKTQSKPNAALQKKQIPRTLSTGALKNPKVSCLASRLYASYDLTNLHF